MVDHAIINTFFTWGAYLKSLVPTMLANTLIFVDICSQKLGKQLKCCSPLLYV
uniref:DUF7745 domain-containing protein n=1 Tax=Cajanus cajan TaxID=3821 RepID=A0A151QRC0_CAJCA|nr:hypothetical protein KK1_046365 [Cajanus cajan]